MLFSIDHPNVQSHLHTTQGICVSGMEYEERRGVRVGNLAGVCQFGSILGVQKNNLFCIQTREKEVDKEDLASEIRCRIGCIWPLCGRVACFHEH